MTEPPTPTSAQGTASVPAARRRAQAGSEPAASRLAATTDSRLERAYELLASDAFDVLSLDVFDTILWRKVPEPPDAFLVLALRLMEAGALATDLDPGGFAVLRRRAEGRARRRREESGRGVEVTLREIWQELPSMTLRGMSKDEALAEEVELERSLLVPDLDVVNLMLAAQERGKRLIGVSDTYFSEQQLKSFLGVPPIGAVKLERVFASSDRRIGKGSGLWRIVLDELGVKPKKVLHIGDNHEADVVVPTRLGIGAVYFERRTEQLNRVIGREDRHATAPLRPHHGDYGLTALRAKVLHRTERRDQPPALRDLWGFGAASLGPPLTGFAEWVHERAREEGVSKVFCLMREGDLFARLVNGAAAYLNSPLTADPIWLSRQLCARASIYEGTRDELTSLFIRIRMPTVGELCRTLGLDAAEVPGFAGRADARLDQPHLPEELLDTVSGTPDLRSRVVTRSSETRARIARYVESLRPEGEGRLALVDLGWGGTIQWLLDALLRRSGVDLETVGLYLMTDGRAADRMLDGVRLHGFLASAGHPARPVEAFRRSPEILEQICMPNHGSQVDLTAELEPVLADDDTPEIQAVEREAVQKGIFAFQREWGRYRTAAPTSLVAFHEWGQDRLRSILVRAVTAPTPDEATLFAGWLHDENFGSTGSAPMVPLTSARAARYVEPHALVETPMSELYWPFGLASLHDERLAESVEAVSTGALPWEALSSELETGRVEIYVDRGWGFRGDGMVAVAARRNRLGLSYANGTVAGDIVRRVRIDPVKAASVVRIDWIRLRCHLRDGDEVVTLDFDTPDGIAGLKLSGMDALAPGAYQVEGVDPNIVIDVEEMIGREIHTVDVECAFAVLPLPASPIRTRYREAKARLRDRLKRSRAAAPLRAVYSLMRRFD
jgi:FMN phosphatase YigB (HAD superfamily)